MFEGEFTSRVARLDAVEAAMPTANLDGFDVRARTTAYLTATLGTVGPFYRLEKAGAFAEADPRGGAFVTERLAAGAAELRDWITAAWRASASSSIGWPAVKVAEVEAGTADPWLAMVGADRPWGPAAPRCCASTGRWRRCWPSPSPVRCGPWAATC